MYTKDIRNNFLKFFEKKGHQIVPSSPLVPHNDPTLMFTNAGMVQFKNVFTGLESRPYTTAATSQKCVRAGGKHNDLENVGYTARHHTFFEMLGNFSFGDYFKEEAIAYAWELLTQEFGLSKDKLYITVFDQDEESLKLWKKLTGFSDEKIIKIATSDNFWSMGDVGPCGPCTEIFYDHGDHIPGGLPGTPEEDGDRFVEIWNLVFMQYEKQKNGSQIILPKSSVDTGMGLERIAAVLQGFSNNYETDIFKYLIMAVAEKTKTQMEGDALVSQRVIADHLRSCCFLMADGVMPSNEGRGYVLRRIMRRAMRHAYKLNAKEPLLCALVPFLVEKMGAAFPELERAKDLMVLTLQLEEERFGEAFARGVKVLEDGLKSLEGKTFSGLAAFKLYDTYGFPLDLTQDILKGQHINVNVAEFDQAMQHQKEMARASWTGSGGTETETLWFDLREKHGATEFVGYQTTAIEGSITALVKEGADVSSLKKGETGFFVANQTPFYGESGGQKGDTGTLVSPHVKAVITDTLKKGDLFVHAVDVTEGTLSMGDEALLTVDVVRRDKLRANHSATHLLHEALRRTMGSTVTQKGSLVAPDRLRFDFSCPKAVPQDVLRQVAKEINVQIRSNALVATKLSSPEEAMKEGAQALFGEKYGDEVRVVSMGLDQDAIYSVELCGGTHVERLGDIGSFKILSESSVSAGIRRIEAITGAAVETHSQEMEATLSALAETLKSSVVDLPKRVASLVMEKKKLEKEMRTSTSAASAGVEACEKVGDTMFLSHQAEGLSGKDLKPLMDTLKKKVGSGVVLLTSVREGKVAALVGVTADLTERYKAGHLILAVSQALGGKGGGGRADLAQCGGTDSSKVEGAVDALKKAL
jgi:alanyl-tRNA synthetase